MSKVFKHISVNGQEIPFTYRHNQWWIPLAPVCEALELDSEKEARIVVGDEILRQEMNQFRFPPVLGFPNVMKCLPMFHFFGWLMQLEYTGIKFKKQQWECFFILFKHFHPNIKQQETL